MSTEKTAPSKELQELINHIRQNKIDSDFGLGLNSDGILYPLYTCKKCGKFAFFCYDFGFDCSEDSDFFYLFNRVPDDDPIQILLENGIVVSDLDDFFDMNDQCMGCNGGIPANAQKLLDDMKARNRHEFSMEAMQDRFLKHVISRPTEDTVCELKKMGLIEISGTQYEGRPERIDLLKVGDKVDLVREPNNAYDKYAIAVQNASGSLGYIPSSISDMISTLMDAGRLACTANVAQIIPLSMRGRNAKKPIVKLWLTYTILKSK